MHNRMRTFVLTALLLGMIFLLGFTPIGMIPLGFIYLSLLGVPVIVGALALGWKSGMILGAGFASVSLMKAFGIGGVPSTLVVPLLERSAVLVVIMSVLPRLLVPLTACLVYKAVSRGSDASNKAVTLAAVAGSLTNTVFYLGLMLLFYCVAGIDSKPVLALIGGTGLIAGSAEAVVAALIATPVMAALRKLQKRN